MQQNWQRFKDSFEKFIIQDLNKSLKSDIEVGTIFLTVIGLECLSGYFVGKPSNKETFISFINAFMPRYFPHAKAIYQCIRNGLSHDYIIKESEGQSFLFTRNRGEKHLIPLEGKPKWFYFNREQFALDFLDAQRNYFEQVDNDQELFERAVRRLKLRNFLDVFSYQFRTSFVNSEEIPDEYNGVTGTSRV